ncbi:8750_t:CDS:2, partial [Acaulospora morrowiae]
NPEENTIMFSSSLQNQYQKQLEGQHNFFRNCRPTTARFNIVRRLTAGLSKLYQQLYENQNALHANARLDRSFIKDFIKPYEMLAHRYRVINKIGRGTFSQVVCAEDTYYPVRHLVAIKIMAPQFNSIGIQESKTLLYLNLHADSDNIHLVKISNTFMFEGHFCMVLDYYEGGVPQLPRISNEEYRLQVLRKFACQLLITLMYLRKWGILHADLKLENIIRTKATSLDLRVIDFGSAMRIDEVHVYFNTFEAQTLAYRAPEVIMGLPFGIEIDMWSFGCILCELWLGYPIFYSSSKHGVLREIEKLLGPLPDSVYRYGKFFSYYKARPDGGIRSSTGIEDQNMLRIERICRVLKTQDINFVNFVDYIFNCDPSKRPTPSECLFHPFFAPLFPFKLLFDSHLVTAAIRTAFVNGNNDQGYWHDDNDSLRTSHNTKSNLNGIMRIYDD